MSKRLPLVLVLAFLSFVAIVSPQPTAAQATWSYVCDFKVTDGGWGHWTATWAGVGSGWYGDSAPVQAATIYNFATTGFTITIVNVWGGSTPNTLNGSGYIWWSDGESLFGQHTGGMGLGGYGAATNYPDVPALVVGAWVNNVRTYVTKVSVGGTGTNPFGKENCEEEPEPPGPIWTKPLAQADEDSALYDLSDVERRAHLPENQAVANYYPVYSVLWSGEIYAVHAWSHEPGAFIHSPAVATVLEVSPLVYDDCGIGIYQYDPLVFETIFTSYYSEEPAPCMVGFPDFTQPDNALPAAIWPEEYYLDPTNVYKVVLEIIYTNEGVDTTYNAIYLARNAINYVVPGDEIGVGCILGETAALTSTPVNDSQFLKVVGMAAGAGAIIPGTFGLVSAIVGAAVPIIEWVFPAELPDSTDRGYTLAAFYDTDGDDVDAIRFLDEYPTNESPCNQTSDFAACKNVPGARFENNGSDWTTSGGNVTWLNPGVILPPNSSVSMNLNLDTEVAYNVIVRGKGVGDTGEVRIWLGRTTERLPILNEVETLQMPVDPLEPDQGLVTTIGLQNTGMVNLEILSVCVVEGDAAIGDGCYFAAGMDDWTGSEGVLFADTAALVPDNGTISHEATLPAGEYELTINAAWWYDPPIAYLAQAAITYEFPAAGGYAAMSPNVFMGGTMLGNSLTATATFTVATETTSDLSLKVDISGTGIENVDGLQIISVCLRSTTEGGIGELPPLKPSCSYLPRPTNSDVGHWLNWHWHQLNRFFQCDLMVLLNKMWQTMRDTQTMIGWSIRWNMYSVSMYNDWAGRQLFPWLAGHFRNMAIGQITTIEQSGGVGIWDVLLALIQGVFSPLVGMIGQIVGLLIGLITQVANLLLAVLTGGISLVLAFIGQALNLLMMGQQMLSSIITAYNTADPAAVPGLPTCYDPKSHWLCTGVWILDNTIFGGPGAALIPLIVSILSIHLVLWVIGEIKQTITGLGQSS